MTLEEFEYSCKLCERVTYGDIFFTCSQLFNNDEKAKEFSKLVATTIRDIYKDHPPFFCGRSKNTIIGSMIYLQSLLLGLKFTQSEIAKILGITSVSIRTNYKRIAEKLDLDVYGKRYRWRFY